MRIRTETFSFIAALVFGIGSSGFAQTSTDSGRGGSTPAATGGAPSTNPTLPDRGSVTEGTTGSMRGDSSGGNTGKTIGRSNKSTAVPGTNTARAECDPKKNPNAKKNKNCLKGSVSSAPNASETN